MPARDRISDAVPVRIVATTAVAKAATAGKILVEGAGALAAVADAVVAGVPVALPAGVIFRLRNTHHRKVAARNRAATRAGTISAIRDRIAVRSLGVLSLVAAKNAASIIAVPKHPGTAELLRVLRVSIRRKNRFCFRANRWQSIVANRSHLRLLL